MEILETYEWGAVQIDIKGNIGNLGLVVWDRQIQPPGQPIGREIYRGGGIYSVREALDIAVREISKDSGKDISTIRSDIRKRS